PRGILPYPWPWCLTAMQRTLKACMRMGVLFTLCSLSRIMYTGRVNRPMNVSLSDVVMKILDSFNFKTLHMMSRAAWSCDEESQLPSLSLAAAFPLGFPLPLDMGTVDEDFSAAFVSTVAIVHCSRKP